mgnify:CR=1 FL=1
MIDEELEADIDLAYRYNIVLCLARTPPKVCAPTRHTGHFFHLRVYGHFGQIVFKTSYVPNEVIYTSTGLGKESQVLKVSFYAFLDQNFF